MGLYSKFAYGSQFSEENKHDTRAGSCRACVRGCPCKGWLYTRYLFGLLNKEYYVLSYSNLLYFILFYIILCYFILSSVIDFILI